MYKTHKKAFSLLETMLAVGVLTMMTSVAASIASGASRATAMAEDKMVAIYLAEEAGEVVKNIWQDVLNAGGDDIFSSPLSECMNHVGCYIRPESKGSPDSAIVGCGGAENCGILYITENGYRSDAGSLTRYGRVVTIEEVASDGKRYKVNVDIAWGEEDNKKISFDYYLFPIGIYVTQ